MYMCLRDINNERLRNQEILDAANNERRLPKFLMYIAHVGLLVLIVLVSIFIHQLGVILYS